MKKSIVNFFIVLLITTFAFSASAQEAKKTITLQDGSRIKGTLVSFKDGTYVINTENLGKIELPESEIVNIGPESAAVNMDQYLPQEAAPGQNHDVKAYAQQMQSMLMSDPEIMKKMQELAQDKEVTQMLTNPEYMRAIFSYNPDTIMQNENTKKLMENPKIKELMELIQKKYMQAGK